MRVLGITIESSKMICYALEKEEDGTVKQIAVNHKPFKIEDGYDNAALQHFKDEAYAFIDRIKPDRIAIVKRVSKGKFMASPTSFKLEGILQCYHLGNVEFVAPATLTAYFKKNEFTQEPEKKYLVGAAQMAQYLIEN